MQALPAAMYAHPVVILIMLLCTSTPAWTQSISRDARVLARLCEAKADTSSSGQLQLLTYVNRYIHPLHPDSVNQALKAMGCAVMLDEKTLEMVRFAPTRPSEVGIPTFSTVGGAPVTGMGPKFMGDFEDAVIQGLATFMVDRFESELTAYAIDGILSILTKKDSNTRIDSLFPNTTRFAADLKGNPYHPYSLAYFQSVLRRDIQALPVTMLKPGVLLTDRQREALVPSIDLWNRLMSGDPVDEVLKQVSEVVERDFPKDVGFARKLRHAAWMLRAFATETGTYHPEMGDSLFRMDAGQRRVFTVLMALAMERPVADSLRNLASALSDFHTYQGLAAVVSRTDSAQGTDAAEAARLALELVSVLDGNRSERFRETRRYVEMVLAMDKDKPGQILETFLTTYAGYLGPQTRDGAIVMQLSALAAVKDEDDMTDFLTANALPIGGARIKRQAAFNMSLNGYMGMIGGYEWLGDNRAWMAGLSTPVGVSLNWTFGHARPMERKSISVFLGAIDLSTLITARLDSEDSTTYAAFRLEHLFAPGVGLFYNFQNSPFSVGGYLSHVPNLRTTPSGDEKGVTRAVVSVFVDIPMFTWYNRRE